MRMRRVRRRSPGSRSAVGAPAAGPTRANAVRERARSAAEPADVSARRERAVSLARRRTQAPSPAAGARPSGAGQDVAGLERGAQTSADAAAVSAQRQRIQRARRTEAQIANLARNDRPAFDRVARMGTAAARASAIARSAGLSAGVCFGGESNSCNDSWDCGSDWSWSFSVGWCWPYNACWGWNSWCYWPAYWCWWPISYWYWYSPGIYYWSEPEQYGTVVYNYYYDDDDYDDGGTYYERELAPVGEAVYEPRSIGIDPTMAPELEQVLGMKAGDDTRMRARDHYLELGDQAFIEGRYADAVHYYARAIGYASEDAVLYLVLSDALFATGDYHYGAYALRRALELDPTLVASSVDKRTFYGDPLSFDRQLTVLARYVEDRPDDDDARLLLAANYLFSLNPAAARAVLEGSDGERVRSDPLGKLVWDAAAPAPEASED